MATMSKMIKDKVAKNIYPGENNPFVPKIGSQFVSPTPTREITFYDPNDKKQNKGINSPDNLVGIGGWGTKVKFGDIAVPALGQSNKNYPGGIKIRGAETPKGTLITIESLKDVKTPYGMGVFKVNDTMHPRFGGKRYDIALPESAKGKYPDLKKKIGNKKSTYTIQ